MTSELHLDRLQVGDFITIDRTQFEIYQIWLYTFPRRQIDYVLHARGSNQDSVLMVELVNGNWIIKYFNQQVEVRLSGFVPSFRLEDYTYQLQETGPVLCRQLRPNPRLGENEGRYGLYNSGADILLVEVWGDDDDGNESPELIAWRGRIITERSMMIVFSDGEERRSWFEETNARDYLEPPIVSSRTRRVVATIVYLMLIVALLGGLYFAFVR